MESGWIKLYRKIQNCWIWNSKEAFDRRSAWVDLLLQAMHNDKKILLDNEIIVIKRGSFMTSVVKLSERWKWSRGKTIRFLELLESEQMLSTKRTPKGTLVTIVKYEDFQGSENGNSTTGGTTIGISDSAGLNTPYGTGIGTIDDTPVGTPVSAPHDTSLRTAASTADGTQNKNIKNNKENKECKEEIITVSNETVCQTDVRRIVEAWNSLKQYGIKPVTKISSDSKRYQSLVARINQYGVEAVLSAIERIKVSSFLQGKNDTGWTINFDWFVLPNNFPKVIEGNYDDRDKAAKGASGLEEWLHERTGI